MSITRVLDGGQNPLWYLVIVFDLGPHGCHKRISENDSSTHLAHRPPSDLQTKPKRLGAGLWARDQYGPRPRRNLDCTSDNRIGPLKQLWGRACLDPPAPLRPTHVPGTDLRRFQSPHFIPYSRRRTLRPWPYGLMRCTGPPAAKAQRRIIVNSSGEGE